MSSKMHFDPIIIVKKRGVKTGIHQLKGKEELSRG